MGFTCCERSLIMWPFHAIHSLLVTSLVTNSQSVKLWILTWLGDIQGEEDGTKTQGKIQGEEDGTKTQGNFINWVVGLWVTLNFLLCVNRTASVNIVIGHASAPVWVFRYCVMRRRRGICFEWIFWHGMNFMR